MKEYTDGLNAKCFTEIFHLMIDIKNYNKGLSLLEDIMTDPDIEKIKNGYRLPKGYMKSDKGKEILENPYFNTKDIK